MQCFNLCVMDQLLSLMLNCQNRLKTNFNFLSTHKCCINYFNPLLLHVEMNFLWCCATTLIAHLLKRQSLYLHTKALWLFPKRKKKNNPPSWWKKSMSQQVPVSDQVYLKRHPLCPRGRAPLHPA